MKSYGRITKSCERIKASQIDLNFQNHIADSTKYYAENHL